MTKRYISLIFTIIATAISALAFDLSHYSESSVLASGRWVKVAVEQSGIYMIPTSTLRQWGFSDPAAVRVYGYGGNRIPDLLSVKNYKDDLPQAASEITDAGLVFYAEGPDRWVISAGANYRRERNPYTTRGYYFISDAPQGERLTPASSGSPDVTSPLDMATATVQYEQDLIQATEAGPLMVGEDFRYTPSRTFTIPTPGRVDGTGTWMECQFFTKTIGATSKLAFTVDGNPLQAVSSDIIPATTDSHYIHGNLGQARHNFSIPAGESLTVGITLSASTVIYKANLDYIAVNYQRALTLPAAGSLDFRSSVRQLRLSGADADTRVWDVTDPTAITAIDGLRSGSTLAWASSFTGNRRYVAWKPVSALPAPTFAGYVTNQDLHAELDPADMVIFTTSALRRQAQRIADLHAEADSMLVRVVDVDQVYNEFSSGMPDLSGLRKYLKMVYDRGNAAGRPLAYTLLLGRSTLDHRQLLASTRALGYTTMPTWVPTNDRLSLSDNDGYTTDDVISFLEDNSGSDHGLDHLSVAVGRIPMVSDADGSEIVDKLIQYVRQSKQTFWRNRVVAVADDEDLGIHLRQTESMISFMEADPLLAHLIDKVYLDAYSLQGGVYPDARRDMFRILDEGAVWWFYIGHANDHSWTAEGQLTFTDINNMYLRNFPIVVASTCDFLRWDAEKISGGEIMYKERYGGAIAMISATRPVYISDNGYFLNAFGRNAFTRDDNGRLATAGEVYRRTKNNIINSAGNRASNSNRLRFVFMGDPAMRTASPDNRVEITAINGIPVSDPDAAQIVIEALSEPVISGRITDPFGTPVSDFNGTVTIDLFDAARSVTTNGRGNGSIDVFETHGDKLFTGAAAVRSGEFSLKVAMPSLITDNFRPATISAYATDGHSQAIGINSDFYVYGLHQPETADTIAPEIRLLALNHSGFQSGSTVNSAPVVMAEIADNVGLNLSSAGVGQQMAISIDGTDHYTDVASYFTPASDGSIAGSIAYPLENIADGAHTLRLRVFDTSGNAATSQIDFFVDDNARPQIFEVYTDANPASTSANFYVRHDRPETILSVEVTVYNLLGHPLWTGSARGLSDMDISAPVYWNLTDSAGRRVPRGIYLYRASITTDQAHYTTASRRLAVR